MRIKVKAELTLNVPSPKEGESVGAIMLMAEQNINRRCQRFIMPKTKTQVGTRIHVFEGKQIK